MRKIETSTITAEVKRLCVEANKKLPCDLKSCIKNARDVEINPLAVDVLSDILENLDCASELDVPICQDTGMAVVFVKIGQSVSVIGGDINDAINEGVRQGYVEGNLRCSIVSDPLRRVNTEDNTPAVIHIEMCKGDKLSIMVAPKGFGSENMSRTKMFNPSTTERDIVEFVTETVKIAGSNPCPPIVVGVGIGGDFELCALLSKKALCREISKPNPDPFYAELEKTMLDEINKLDIGVQGFGGSTTALAVNIMQYPTHIAGLPVAVNIGCHVTRHMSVEL